MELYVSQHQRRQQGIARQGRITTIEGTGMAVQERPIEISGIPPELIMRPQWVVWRLIQRDKNKKPTKVPFDPKNGKPASSTDRETWGTYTQALSRVRSRDFRGVGFMFSANDPYVGIDLDGCYNPTTRTFSDTALRILGMIESYAEYSQSGTGIHIIAKATLPYKGRRCDDLGIEIYQEDRYFVMTGKGVPSQSNQICDCQESVNALYQQYFPPKPDLPAMPLASAVPSSLADQEIIDVATRSVNGAHFDALMSGDISMHNNNHSSADLALCNILAFYTSDPNRTDTIFRTSGLYREKWDEKRGEKTYGEITIDEAFRGRTEFYTPPRQKTHPDTLVPPTQTVVAPKADAEKPGITPGAGKSSEEPQKQRYHFLTPKELRLLPHPKWLVDGFITDRGMSVVVGEPKSGKTFLVLDWVLSIAMGTSWNGRDVQQGVVAYIAGEGKYGIAKRLQAWEIRHQVEVNDNFLLLGEPISLMAPESISAVIKEIESFPEPPKIIVIDTLARCMTGGDENSAKDISVAIASIDQLRNHFNCHVLVVHHKNKQGSARGSTALPGAIDTLIDVTRDGSLVTATCVWHKDFEETDPINLYMRVVQLDDTGELTSCVLDPANALPVDYLTKSDEICLRTLLSFGDTGAFSTEWMKATNLADRTFYDALKRMKDKGLLIVKEVRGNSKYSVSIQGKSALSSTAKNESAVRPQSPQLGSLERTPKGGPSSSPAPQCGTSVKRELPPKMPYGRTPYDSNGRCTNCGKKTDWDIMKTGHGDDVVCLECTPRDTWHLWQVQEKRG
jgi:predicted transcriptional regulator